MANLHPSPKRRSLQLFLRGLLLVPLVMMLGSCEDDDDDPEPERCFETTIANCGPGPWDPFGIALSLAWYSGQCTEEVACAADVEVDLVNGIITEEYITSTWTTSTADEAEPNNSSDEANPFVVPASSGLLYDGVANDTTDASDYLALVLDTGSYAMYLCSAPDNCLQPFQTGTALHLELYDQNGVLLESTYMNGAAHSMVFDASAGVLYYLAVIADDTGGVDMAYRLVVTD